MKNVLKLACFIQTYYKEELLSDKDNENKQNILNSLINIL